MTDEQQRIDHEPAGGQDLVHGRRQPVPEQQRADHDPSGGHDGRVAAISDEQRIDPSGGHEAKFGEQPRVGQEPAGGHDPVDGRLQAVPERQRPSEEAGRKQTSGASVLIGVLLALLGFALAVQLRSNSTDNSFAPARESDLLQILSDLDSTERRLNQDISSLQQTKRELQSGAAGRDAALEEATARADELGILAGTLKAHGPGLILHFTENTGTIKAGTLLNAVQELRGAGAEALQIDGGGGASVRVIASTSFVDADGGVRVDGRRLTGPYTIRAIGDPAAMRPAVEIHGGVVAGVTRDGGNVIVDQRDVVEINETRPPPELQNAQPVR